MTTLRNSIRGWALLAVAVSSAFTIGIAVWLIAILSADDWCGKALGAAKYATGRPANAIDACFDLMNAQVDFLGKSLLISIGVQAICLLVLIVIVLAGGKLSLTGPGGWGADIGGAAKDKAAQRVADEAQDAADEIKGEHTPVDPDA